MKSMDIVWGALNAEQELKREQVALGGYPYIATYIDGQLKNSFRNFLLPSVILATLISLVCLRNFILTMIVFVTATGRRCHEYRFGSCLPGKIWRIDVDHPGPGFCHGDIREYSPDSLRIGLHWSTVAAVVNRLETVHHFHGHDRGWNVVTGQKRVSGNSKLRIFSAAGVGFALVMQLTLVPWLLDRFGRSGSTRLATRGSHSHFWQQFVSVVRRRKILCTIVSSGLMIVGGFGLTRLKSEVEVEKLFRPDSEILTAMAELEFRFGPMDQTELLLVFDNAEANNFPDRVELVRKIQLAVTQLPQVAVTHSLINFLPDEPSQTNAALVRETVDVPKCLAKTTSRSGQ